MSPTTPPPSLEDKIANKLARGVPMNDLIMEVCGVTGMAWDDAQHFVNDVSVNHREKIASKRFPLYIILSLGIGLMGAAILARSIIPLQEAIAAASASSSDPTLQIALAVISRTGSLPRILLGLGMLAGGAIGLAKTIIDRFSAA
jgi:hypothetical protein